MKKLISDHIAKCTARVSLILALLCSISLTGYAQLTFQCRGDAVALGGGCFELTPNAVDDIADNSVIWCTNANADFTKPFILQFTATFTAVNGKADGIVVMFGKNLTSATLPNGCGGGNMGFYSVTGCARPEYANNIFGVELDIFNNGTGTFCDIGSDHAAVSTSSTNPCSLAAGGAATPINGAAGVGDGVGRVYRIVWDPRNTTLSLYQMTNSGCRLILRTTTDYRTLFTTTANSVQWGISSATDDSKSSHRLCNITLTQPAPVGTSVNVCVGMTTPLPGHVTGSTWATSNGRASVSSSGVVTGISAGTCIITHNVPCDVMVAHTINVMPAPTAVVVPSSLTPCFGSPVTFTALGTLPGGSITSYAWTTPAPSYSCLTPFCSQITSTPATPGPITYMVTLTGSNGCTRSATATVNVIKPVINDLPPICGATIYTATATPAPGIWSTSPGTAALSSINLFSGVLIAPPSASGTATITYTHFPSGCKATKTVTLSPSPIVSLTAYPSSVCMGSTVTLNAMATYAGSPFPTPALWYHWGSPSSLTCVGSPCATAITTPSTSGINTYYLQVTHPITGCSANTSVNVNVVSPAFKKIPYLCAGQTYTQPPSPATPPGGVWSTVPGTATLTIDPFTGFITAGPTPGTAIVKYTTMPMGCVATQVVTIYASPTITSLTASPNPVCSGNIVTLNSTVSYPGGGSLTGLTFTWSPSAGVGCVGPAPCLTATTIPTSIGPNVYTLKVKNDKTGCKSERTVAVWVNRTPTIKAIPPLCSGDTYGASSSPIYPFGWWSRTNGTGTLTISPSGVIVAGIPGTATVTFTSILGGCTASQVVTINPTPVISGTTMFCEGTTTTLTATPPGGVWSYSSSPISIVSSTGSSCVIYGNHAGTTTITYKIPKTKCYATHTIQVIKAPAVTISSEGSEHGSGIHLMCIGGPLPLMGSPAGGTWGSTVASVATVSPTGDVTTLSAGTTLITYTVAGALGCPGTATWTLTVMPTSSVNPITDICIGVPTPMVGIPSGGTWSDITYAYAFITSTGVVSGFYPGVFYGRYEAPGHCPIDYPVNIIHCPGPIPAATSVDGATSENFARIMITPNPNGGQFTISGSIPSASEEKELQFEIVNTIGQVVHKDVVAVENYTINKMIQLGDHLADGAYILRIKGRTDTRTIRFVLNR